MQRVRGIRVFDCVSICMHPCKYFGGTTKHVVGISSLGYINIHSHKMYYFPDICFHLFFLHCRINIAVDVSTPFPKSVWNYESVDDVEILNHGQLFIYTRF